MTSQQPVLLYDIDGTLLRVRREFLLGLIQELLDLFNVTKPAAGSKSFAGRTDRGIFMELIGPHPDADDLFLQLKQMYTEAMRQRLSHNHIVRIDDAIQSVREATEMGLAVGLCTGNFRDVAYTKVETAGLRDIFSFGGFGGEYSDRNLLPAAADREYQSLYTDCPGAERYVVIGDTPNDIRCAKYFGARSVAVTTGGFSAEELGRHSPDIITDSLSNPTEWLKKLGF